MPESASVLRFSAAAESALPGILATEGLRLTPGEVRRMLELLGRDPTRVEATIFDTMWSEHCSYKSSRWVLKAYLPTESPRVILGPGEDSGVVRLGTHQGVTYALVIAHESHNHPSQVGLRPSDWVRGFRRSAAGAGENRAGDAGRGCARVQGRNIRSHRARLL